MKSQCGGTAISKHTIVTAAHCCINQYRVIAHFNDKIAGSYEPDEFQVESQENFSLGIEFHFTIIPILNSRIDHDEKFWQNFVIHSSYSPNDGNYDICIITVDADLSQKLNSVPCLPDTSIDLDSYHGSKCWIAGWGLTSWDGNFPTKLQSAGVNLMSRSYCLQHRNDLIKLNIANLVFRWS